MGKRINWDKVSEVEEMIRAHGLNLSEGSRKFGIALWQLYELSRRKKKEGRSERGQALIAFFQKGSGG